MKCYKNIDNINKVNAYREVADNLDAAKDIMYQKKLAYGEMAVVPFYHPDKTSENRDIVLLQGTGSLDGRVQFVSNVIDSSVDVSLCKVYVDDASTFMSVQDAINYIFGKMIDFHYQN